MRARREAGDVVGYRRTALLGVVSTAVLLWRARLRIGPGRGAAGCTRSRNGTAKATAVVARRSPQASAPSSWRSAAGSRSPRSRTTLGQAQAQALDLGLIGTTLTAGGCRATRSYDPSSLPQPTRVDNRKGATDSTSDEVPIADSTFGGGRESAWATPSPWPARSRRRSPASGTSSPVRRGPGRGHDRESSTERGAPGARHRRGRSRDRRPHRSERAALGRHPSHRQGSDRRGNVRRRHRSAARRPHPPRLARRPREGRSTTRSPPRASRSPFPKVERFTKPADLVRITPLRIVLKDSPLGKAVARPRARR